MVIGYEYRPGALYLNVTNRCSNDCSFCVRQGPGYSLAGFDMRLEREPTVAEVLADVERQIDERGALFDEVVFCGFGEPTIRLELVSEVGAILRARGQPVRLNTNGQAALLNERDPWPVLVDAIDAVSVSLNAPDAESYVELCSPRLGLAAYEAILTFARRATELLDDVSLTVVSGAIDQDAIDRCAALADEMGAAFRIR